VIVASIAGILAGGYLVAARNPDLDEATARTVFTLQAKVLFATARLAPAAARTELQALEPLAASPGMAPAVAALRVGIPGDDGEAETAALMILDRFESDTDPALHAAVRDAIVSPETVDAESAGLVEEELGWLGRLLLTRTRPDGDTQRRAVRRDAIVTFVMAVGLVVAGTVGALVGLGLLVVAAILRGSGKLVCRGRDPAADDRVYLQAFAVYLGFVSALGLGITLTGVAAVWVGLAVLAAGSVLGVSWPFLRGVDRKTALRDLGLYRGEGLAKEIGCGLVGYVAILPIVVAGIVGMLVLTVVIDIVLPTPPGDPPPVVGHPALVWIARGSTAVRLAVLFLAAAFAPFFEETMFRGAFLSGTRRSLGVVGSIALMSLIFAAIHPQGFVTIPALGALAAGFALLREWRGSLVAPMVAHALHNGTLVCFMWIAVG
jgi:membrane protease YdiL (CAAX protease family)